MLILCYYHNMSESPHYPNGPEGKHPGGLRSVITGYLAHATPPPDEDIDAAASLISGAFREIEHSGDAFSICQDLVVRFNDATTILATLLTAEHESLPERWVDNPETGRIVLLMTGDMEIGRLHALQRPVVQGGAFPGLTERLGEVEAFVGALEQTSH